MEFGFFSAVLRDLPLETVAAWAAKAGFTALELDADQHVGDPSQVGAAVATARKNGLKVCTITVTGNLLDVDLLVREQLHLKVAAMLEEAIEHGVPQICVFPGRNFSVSEGENYRQLADYLDPLTAHAAQGNVTIVMENWPGPRQNYLATTPDGWTRLFELVPAPNLGLNFDPSHLIWQGIDIEAALAHAGDRVFLTHAKDTEIFPDRLQQVGYFGSGWWSYRLPGHGVIDWGRWLNALGRAGFDGVVSIEHEDPDWGGSPDGTVEQRQAGLREALAVLTRALPENQSTAR
jgi:sugar phosphate isomerase/epimerase